jgi:hypothetical protein
MTEFSRIEELENALEALLECFDCSFEGRPWIEVEVQATEDDDLVDKEGLVITEGQVNQTTADAIALAEEVLYKDEMSGGEYGEE